MRRDVVDLTRFYAGPLGVAAQAMRAARPKTQYLIGPGARKMKNLARLPTRLRDWLMYKAIYTGCPS